MLLMIKKILMIVCFHNQAADIIFIGEMSGLETISWSGRSASANLAATRSARIAPQARPVGRRLFPRWLWRTARAACEIESAQAFQEMFIIRRKAKRYQSKEVNSLSHDMQDRLPRRRGRKPLRSQNKTSFLLAFAPLRGQYFKQPERPGKRFSRRDNNMRGRRRGRAARHALQPRPAVPYGR